MLSCKHADWALHESKQHGIPHVVVYQISPHNTDTVAAAASNLRMISTRAAANNCIQHSFHQLKNQTCNTLPEIAAVLFDLAWRYQQCGDSSDCLQDMSCAQGVLPEETRFTCTACAGTMLLEFGTLSRLTGNPIYEQKARHAMQTLFGEGLRSAIRLAGSEAHVTANLTFCL